MAAFEFLTKIGDNALSDKGYKQGMFHRCKPAGHKWGTGTLSRFAVVRIDGIPDLATAQAMCQPPAKYNDTLDYLKYQSSYYIDFTEIEKVLTVSQYKDLSDRRIVSSIIDLSFSKLKPIEVYDFARSFIHGSVSSGSYDVDGVGTGDPTVAPYEYLSDAIADMAATLTGNLTFTITANHTDDAAATIVENLDSNTLLITAASHSGYKASAKQIKLTTGGPANYLFNAAEGPGEIIVENLYFYSDSNNVPSSQFIYGAGVDTDHDFTIRRNFIKGARVGGGDSTRGIRINDATFTPVIHSNVLWNLDSVGIMTSTPAVCENNTVYGCDVGVLGNNVASTFENNAVYGGTCWLTVGGATGNNNISSDTTGEDGDFSSGSNNVSSATAADDFASLTDTDTDFLWVKDTDSALYDTGKTGTYSNPDNAGVSRPQGSAWDKGAFELVVAGTTVDCTTGTLSIAGIDPVISAGTLISGTLGTLAIAGLDPSVSVGTNIDATLGTLAIVGFNPSISVGADISCTKGNLDIAGLNPDISVGIDISCTLGALEIVAFNATIDVGVTIDCTLGTLSIAGLNPEISAGTSIDTTLGTLAIAALNANINLGLVIDCALGTLGIAGINSTVSAETIVDATTGVVVVQGYDAVVDLALTIDATLGTLAIVGFNSVVSAGTIVECVAGTVTISGINAVVAQPIDVDCTVGALDVTGHDASILASVLISVTTGALDILGRDAIITVGEPTPTPLKRIFAIAKDDRIYSIAKDDRIYSIT